MVIKLLLLSLLFFCLDCKWELYSINVTHPKNPVGRLEVTWLKGSDGLIYFNSSAIILMDLERQKSVFSIYEPTSASDQIIDHLYIQATIDLCRWMKGVRSNVFMNVILDAIFRNTNSSHPSNFFHNDQKN